MLLTYFLHFLSVYVTRLLSYLGYLRLMPAILHTIAKLDV